MSLSPATRSVVRTAVAAAAAILLSTSARSFADEPSSTDKALAETLFRAGRKLLDDGNAAEACPKLEESYRLEAKLGTLLNMALCHEQLGKTATAWAELVEVGSQATRLKQDDRAAFAKERSDALEKKLSRLTISAPSGAAGLSLTLDGKALSASALGLSVPLDPGEHRVEAKAPGKTPYSIAVTIAPGPASKTLEIPPLADATPQPVLSVAPLPTSSASASSSAPPLPTSAPSVAPVTSGGNGLLVGSVVTGSIGVVGLALGSIFGGLTFSTEADARAICPDKLCPTVEGVNKHAQAQDFATLSTVGFGVGIAGAAASITLFLLSRSAPESPKKTGSALSITPSAGPGQAGFALTGRW